MKRSRSILKIIAISILLSAILLLILAKALWQVLHGRGGAVYTNVYGLALHYTSVLLMVVAVVSALGVACVARVVHLRRYGEPVSELRDLESQTPYTDPGDSK